MLTLEQYASYLDTRDLPWPAPPEIEPETFRPVCVDDPDLCEAMRLHHIGWAQ